MTKDQPGCYFELLKYLYEKDDISPFVFIDIKCNSILDLPRYRGKLKYKFKTLIGYRNGIYYQLINKLCDLSLQIVELGKSELLQTDDFIFDKILYWKYRPLKDFPSYFELKRCGTYKDSLGGGWYSNCELYEIDNQYFAPTIETTQGYAQFYPQTLNLK